MEKNPLVSVIMNCYNSGEFLREAINSVYAQTYPFWEIVFCDNCSTDGSAEIAQSYNEKVKYYKGEKNVPLGEARNFALEKANGEIIAFLDCDDIWLPKKLEKQVPKFFEDEKTGLVFTDTIFFNEKGDLYNNYSSTQFFTGYCFKELLKSYWISMETVAIKKDAEDGSEGIVISCGFSSCSPSKEW